MLTATIACVPKPQRGQVLDCPGELLSFLKGVSTNNLLLVDNAKEVISRLQEAVRSSCGHIPYAYEKRLAVMVESLSNLPTVVALPFVAMDRKDDSGLACAALTHRAAGESGADAFVVVPPVDVQAARDLLPQAGAEVVDLRTYGASVLEQRRDAFCEQIATAERDAEVVTGLFRRTLRYSRSLNLYDRNIGQYFDEYAATPSDRNKRIEGRKRFARSLVFFLTQWRETQHASPGALTARVLTAFDRERVFSWPRAEQDGFDLRVRDFAEEVAGQTGVRLEIQIKRCPWRVAHDRYLETDQAVLALPGGIDIIDSASTDAASTPSYRFNRNVQLVRGEDVRKELLRYSDAKTFLRIESER
jgi:hypothetical protein